MCGGVYEEDFDYIPKNDTEDAKEKGSSVCMESRDRGVMGDIKFMTAGEYMSFEEEITDMIEKDECIAQAKKLEVS